MNIKKRWLYIGLVAVMSPASALNVGGYTQARETDIERLKVYISGVGSGVTAANSLAEPALYCQPNELSLKTDNYLSIIDNQIRDSKALYPSPEEQEDFQKVPVSLVLTWGFMREFPCR